MTSLMQGEHLELGIRPKEFYFQHDASQKGRPQLLMPNC